MFEASETNLNTFRIYCRGESNLSENVYMRPRAPKTLTTGFGNIWEIFQFNFMFYTPNLHEEDKKRRALMKCFIHFSSATKNKI